MPIQYGKYTSAYGIYVGSKSIGFVDEAPYGFVYPLGFDPLQELVKKCGLLMSHESPAVDGILEDKIGDESRDAVKAKYILGDGILTADLGLANEPITYLDGDTLLDVADTTDGSGLFTFPDTVKVANIKIPSTGGIFYLQEGTGDTIADSVNGRIAKLSSAPTFTDINTVKSQADQLGYTISNGENYAWDEDLTDVIWENVIIPNLTKNLSVAYYSEIPIIDPIIKAMRDAYATMYIDGDSAGGLGIPGINSPLTNPWEDVVNEVGNNLADPIEILLAGANNVTRSDNIITVDPNTAMYGNVIWEDFKANTQYTFSFECKRIDGGSTPRLHWYINYTDATSDVLVSNTSTSYVAQSITSASGKTIESITVEDTISGRALDYRDLMLNEGTSALPYEIYAKNNAGLIQFAGTTSDGYDMVTVPNGTVTMLKADGTNSYCTIADASSLDPTGTEDFAFCLVIKTDATLKNGYIVSKGGSLTTDHQFKLFIGTDGSVRLFMPGFDKKTSAGLLSTNTIHFISVKRIAENLKIEVDGVVDVNQANSTVLASKDEFALFARVASGTPSSYQNVWLGFFSFFYNGATGLNETDVDNACALAKAKYFA